MLAGCLLGKVGGDEVRVSLGDSAVLESTLESFLNRVILGSRVKLTWQNGYLIHATSIAKVTKKTL